MVPDFVQADYWQPPDEQAAFTGLEFGSIDAATGQLWIPMVAHAAFDVTAVALIYWNWEGDGCSPAIPVAALVPCRRRDNDEQRDSRLERAAIRTPSSATRPVSARRTAPGGAPRSSGVPRVGGRARPQGVCVK